MSKFLLCFGAWLRGGLAATWVTVHSNSLFGIVVMAIPILAVSAWLTGREPQDRDPYAR